MAQLNSFRDVIKDRFYDEIFNEIAVFVEENPYGLEKNTHNVQSPDEATLDDFEIRMIDIIKSQGNEIDFDVIVVAQIEIAETVRRNRQTDSMEQWFKISCSAKLDDGLKDFSVSDISVYNYRSFKAINVSEYLVPIIYKEQLDDVAEAFLKKYYPEALKQPMAVATREIAERMGLDIKEVHITKTCTVFGQVYFSDCEIQYYDSDARAYKPLNVKRGTILVDPNVYFMRNIGSMNNTIIHECVHWELHKNFFELEKLYNRDARSISCQVKEGIRPEKHRTPLDWMEWHANSIAPRILMPAKQTRQKIEELIDKNKRVLQDVNIADIMESVVFELAEFFEVSRIAAKIRMIDLGYTEAIGVLTYIDDHYISNYSFERSALKNNQTFTISIQDSLFEYTMNPDFRKLLDSGKYVYIDAHFCINDTKYIRRNENGHADLTDYARQHIDECCLVFDIKTRKNERYGVKHYKECVLFRDAESDTIVETKYSNSKHNNSIEKRAEELKKIGLEAKQVASIFRQLPSTFADTLIFHMDRLKYTEEALAENALVTAKTIQRMRNDIRYKSKLETVVAVCIGMQLYPVLSMDMVTKAGHTFKQFDEEHIIYQWLLNSKYQCSIYECNEILRANNCKVLCKEE